MKNSITSLKVLLDKNAAEMVWDIIKKYVKSGNIYFSIKIESVEYTVINDRELCIQKYINETYLRTLKLVIKEFYVIFINNHHYLIVKLHKIDENNNACARL